MLNHICEQKRRHLQKDDKAVRLGFTAYREYWLRNTKSKNPTYDQFMKNRMYTAFVSFGRYLKNINPISMMGFIDYLIKADVPLSKWQSPDIYTSYILQYNRSEFVDDACERMILVMQQWAASTGESYIDFFRKIAPPLAVLWIQSGKISPWLIYIAPSASDMFDRFSDEQSKIVEDTIDTKFWENKLSKYSSEVEYYQKMLSEAGL